jgi:glycosyltransferase involved in cell wall biosynthesis
MAASKPVVAARSGATGEVVLDGITGSLVDYGDVPALASVLTGLLTDHDRRQQLGEAGRQRIDDHFTVDHFVSRVGRLLDEVR